MSDKCKLASEVDVNLLQGSLVFNAYDPLKTGTIVNIEEEKALIRWENGEFQVLPFESISVIKTK